jgi:ribosome-binding factor A
MVKKSSRRILRSLCAQAGPGDGIDPRLPLRGSGPKRRSDRKARQLCGQVAETLEQALAELADPLLNGLHVAGVIPAPNAGRLLVTVAIAPGDAFDPAGVLESLDRAAAALRAEVARAITRRKAPALVYRVAVPAG